MEKMEIGCGKPTGAMVGEPVKDEVIEQEKAHVSKFLFLKMVNADCVCSLCTISY